MNLKIVFKRRRRISKISAAIKPIAYNLLFTNRSGHVMGNINPFEYIDCLRNTYGIRSTAKITTGLDGKLSGYEFKIAN